MPSAPTAFSSDSTFSGSGVGVGVGVGVVVGVVGFGVVVVGVVGFGVVGFGVVVDSEVMVTVTAPVDDRCWSSPV